jgi:TPR repeat protein
MFPHSWQFPDFRPLKAVSTYRSDDQGTKPRPGESESWWQNPDDAGMLPELKQDPESVRAAERYRVLAERGDPMGQYNYGQCLEKGIGAYRHRLRAIDYYWLSAEQGNSWGQCNYGRWLEKGIGGHRDLEGAVKYYRLSAEQGNPLGQCNYGHCLEKGIVVDQDLVSAVTYYRLSAEQGDPLGQYNYGRCLEEGIVVDQDLVSAAKYYQLSAMHGNSQAQCKYGRCLEEGIGVDQDLEYAVLYYHISALQVNPLGQYHYGRCLEEGIGIEQDWLRAGTHYRIAAILGCESAKQALSRFPVKVKVNMMQAGDKSPIVLQCGDKIQSFFFRSPLDTNGRATRRSSVPLLGCSRPSEVHRSRSTDEVRDLLAIMSARPSIQEVGVCEDFARKGDDLARECRPVEAARMYIKAICGSGESQFSKILTWMFESGMKQFCSEPDIRTNPLERFAHIIVPIMGYRIWYAGARAAVQLIRAADAEPDRARSKRLRKEAIFLMLMEIQSDDVGEEIQEQLRHLYECQ